MKLLPLLPLLGVLNLFAAENWPLKDFPRRIRLDWNKAMLQSDRNVHLKFDPGKLARLAGVPASAGNCAAAAETSSGFRRLPVFQTSGSIFFTPPEDTKALWLYFGAPDGDSRFAAPDNDLFKNVLEAGGWRIGGRNEKVRLHPEIIFPEDPEQGRISRLADGLLFSARDVKKRHFVNFFKDVKLPENSAGSCHFEIGFTSLSRMAWGMGVRLHQFDGKGRILPVGVVDPRWLAPLTVPGKDTLISLPGRIHPEAEKIRIHIALSAVPQKYDVYGRALAGDSTDALPVLKVSRLSLRSGLEMPLQAFRSTLFSPVEKGTDDYALFFDGRTAPFFSTSGQGVWAEAHVLRSQKHYAWPLGDGTVEVKIDPLWKEPEKTITLIDAYEHTQGYMFRVTYQRSTKTLTLIIREFPKRGLFRWEAHDRRLIGKRRQWQVKTDIPENVWSDLAFCWGRSGVRIFLNGKKILEDGSYRHHEAVLTLHNNPDKIVPYAVALGTEVRRVRGIAPRLQPFFHGRMNELRISSKMRYDRDYTPVRRFRADPSTLALFTFDRVLDGVRHDGEKFIDGSLLTADAPREGAIHVEAKNGTAETIPWVPAKLAAENDPRRFLNKLNYRDVPRACDFRTMRREHRKKLTLEPGGKAELFVDGDPLMESVEIFCPADAEKPLRAPFLLNAGDIDPRSYGDLRDSLGIPPGATDAQKVRQVFNMLLKSSDYFLSNQVCISADGVSRPVMYEPMTLLNSYCGFECGPLNNMAVNLFANVAGCPSSPADGYYHAFEQVLIDGKWALYDLSAQTCFPARDRRTQASLAEIEKDPYLMYQFHTSPVTGASSDHFIRSWRRSYHVHIAQFPRRMDYVLNPGESFRYHWFNDGSGNILVTDRMKENAAGHWQDVTQEQQLSGRTGRLRRFFPDSAVGIFSFRGRPSRKNPAFFDATEKSFCYRIDTPYPIVKGRYAAAGKDGRPISLACSRDNGRTFFPLTEEALTEPIMARTSLIVRVNAPTEEIGSFSARTFVQLNPRLLGGALKKGGNRLTLKADSGPKAEIVLTYRTEASPAVIGGLLTSGARRGAELKLAAWEAGKTLTLPVTGLSSRASVTATQGFTAQLKAGRLEVTSPPGVHQMGEIKITDGGLVTEVAVVSAPGCRMLTADRAKVSGKSRVCPPDEDYAMPVVRFGDAGDAVRFDFAPVPAGNYLLFTLFRQPQGGRGTGGFYDTLALADFGKKPVVVGYIRNGTADFYKACYGTDLSRLKWDYPLDGGAYPYQPQLVLRLPETKGLTFRALHPGLAFGGALLLPCGGEAFDGRLRQLLTGINCNFWRIKDHE
ncbi:MAG: hypothetical protein IJS01_00265 [Lentisphaeria bacterium]|nr:hypothetical protein [Lentisphaeria bacterium]